MYARQAYQTRDGVIHLTKRDADRHAENAYGNQLTKIAAQIAPLGKYVAIADYVEAHLDDFALLIALAADRDLINPDEEA